MDNSRANGHPPREIVSIADTCSGALQNMPRLEIWLKEHGLPVDPALVPLMCLQAAFFTPWTAPESTYQVARLTTWLMAIDNVLDAPADVTQGDGTGARVRAWHRVIAGADVSGEDPVEHALADITGGLRQDGRPELVALWRHSMHRTLTGMRRERAAAETVAAGGSLPRLTDYLRHGAWTIGVEQQVTALWALMDDVHGLAPHLPVLRGALRHGAIAIRLLNDLRGHHRERTEGKADALAIGLSAPEAHDRAEVAVEACRRALAPLTAAAYIPAVALERVILWHSRMYHRFDPVRPGNAADIFPPPRKDPKVGMEQEILDAIASGGEYDAMKLAELFDRLEPVDAGLLTGTWKGGGFESASENAVLLAQMKWYGKRFVDSGHVEPLLCLDENGKVFSYEEMGLATLHEVVFRGKPSTAMVYDQLPVIDHFRRITDDVLLCVMDKKGDPTDFYFHLTRVPEHLAFTSR
ncbi:DUF4334 domain-containing protein [Streptomyces albireticuli]|nr:DUF4334 domain-containing protein [Streptomyces albireticuli]MCD9141381.1 DUF4334 domain-containing protein [Streptomyces albireticuli]MCD9160658.1 DUF4334 domain-containing protein [Streptomyces albireticuli]MCD9195786.1 DUF4334 domain-containing protein [Streptomyces albireticuli]